MPMPVKPFSPTLLKQILDPIDIHIKTHSGPFFAAFDADGTLWDSDVGESFFQYQIDHCQLPELSGLDPWLHYKTLKSQHPPDAYLWLAQICTNFTLAEVRDWAQKCMEDSPPLVFESQKELIQELLARKIEVFVVSASTHWAVEAAVSAVGLPPTAALGVKTKIENGFVTQKQDGAITWREGKRLALLERTQNRAPLFTCGNTLGDLHLLEVAQISRLAVQTQSAPSPHRALYLDEQNLLKLARERQWLTHQFSTEA